MVIHIQNYSLFLSYLSYLVFLFMFFFTYFIPFLIIFKRSIVSKAIVSECVLNVFIFSI